MKTFLCVLVVFFLLNQASYGESARHRSGKRKVWIGLGLLGAGLVLAVRGESNIFDHKNTALYSGIAVTAAGVATIVYGLHQMKTGDNSFAPIRLSQDTQTVRFNFYAGPSKRGAQGGISLLW